MAIGALRCVVFDVTDLEVAEAFWSEVTGLEVIGSACLVTGSPTWESLGHGNTR